jgi:cobalamin biosynthesis protein CobT
MLASRTLRFSTLIWTLAALTPACDDGSGDDMCGSSQGDGGSDGGGNDGGGNDGGSNDGGSNDGGSNDDGSNDDGSNDDGSNDDGSNDDGSSGNDVGETCQSNADCDDLCVFAGDVDYGICTIECDSWTDCPDFWDCAEIGNASGTYCVPS